MLQTVRRKLANLRARVIMRKHRAKMWKTTQEFKREMIKSVKLSIAETLYLTFDKALEEEDPNKRKTLLEQSKKGLQISTDFLFFLRQSDLRRKLNRLAIEIPDRYLRDPTPTEIPEYVRFDMESLPTLPKILTTEGERWARVELRKLSRENIEFYVKLIVPVLSLIVSIFAIVIAASKK